MKYPEIVITIKNPQQAESLIRSLRYIGHEVKIFPCHAAGAPSASCRSLVITDDEDLSGALHQRGIKVAGVRTEGSCPDGSFFKGADIVLTSLNAAQASYISQAACRLFGIPNLIAETRRLLIRESTEDDFEVFWHLHQKHGTDRLTFSEQLPAGREEPREKYFAYVHTAYRFYGFGLWTVLDKNSGRIIGRCGLSPQADRKDPDGRIEIGYLIAPGERRKGYGLEACRAILKYAFETLECEDVYARIHEENYPSRILAGRLGFRRLTDMGDGTWLWKLEHNKYQGG